MSNNKTVLIVDDEILNIKLHGRILEKMGFRVIDALNGVEALKMIDKQGMPDLIITDWVMPIMNGKKLLQALRNFEEIPPIIIVSGGTVSDDAPLQDAISLGAKIILSKPINVSKFITVVKSYLSDSNH